MSQPSRYGIKPSKNTPLYYTEVKRPRTFLLTNSVIEALDNEINNKKFGISRSEFLEQLLRKKYKLPLP